MKIKLIPRMINKQLYLKMFKSTLVNLMRLYKNTKAMSELEREFDGHDVEVALSCVYVDGDYIVTNSSNKLLRLLEFGGPGVKALNLLTKASKELDGRYL